MSTPVRPCPSRRQLSLTTWNRPQRNLQHPSRGPPPTSATRWKTTTLWTRIEACRESRVEKRRSVCLPPSSRHLWSVPHVHLLHVADECLHIHYAFIQLLGCGPATTGYTINTQRLTLTPQRHERFFFSHIGWLLCRKHPEVIKKGKKIDLSDLMADPVVRFHRKYYLPLVITCAFVLTTLVPMYLWNETFLNSLFVATFFRYCFSLHQTWLVNSAAHMWGSRPYDVNISPRENVLVVLGAVGEGFHNYHHTFPYDYAASEYGIKNNFTTFFIDIMAWLGLAYDRKTASRSMISERKLRTGENRPKGQFHV
ncbi:stearoyl-CoA desaturase 5 [Caerostris extrusa]|uniref:Stearoyl-CoA desaturase 5 n=1 Tax=Caerostris extrusa TaxID=172846 RepID=A0AAV4MKR2_CAEEX|nr:stearoyl-CoA desaturase 5 [Caerostris extrusa]